MKKILLLPIALILGAGVGAGGGYGADMLLGPSDGKEAVVHEDEDVPTIFVPLPRLVAPLVLADGHMSGYVAFEAQLEVAETDAEEVTQKVPFLQHAINMRTYRTPLAAGIDGSIPDLDLFRKVVVDASAEVLGAKKVRRVAITQAVPD